MQNTPPVTHGEKSCLAGPDVMFLVGPDPTVNEADLIVIHRRHVF